MANLDQNGLTLSNASDSGYKHVTTLFDGPLAGRFIAFADVTTNELQAMNKQYKHGIDGFFGFKNVVPLGVFDDVRDAAYVGQEFYGTSGDDRDENLEELFAGNTSVVAVPHGKWDNPADVVSMNKAKKRIKTRRMGKVFDPKKADKAVDVFANQRRLYKIGNMENAAAIAAMKPLFEDGMSLTLAAETVCEKYKR